MSGSTLLQVGTLFIDLGPSATLASSTSWSLLTVDQVENLLPLATQDDTQDVLKTLLYLLSDTGLSFQASYLHHGEGILIRATLLPSDAPDSLWKRVPDRGGRRKKHLHNLFRYLHQSWDGLGERVLGHTAEDEDRLADLYISVPSPHSPEFDHAKAVTPADEGLFGHLETYTEPDGVSSRLYGYQFRSVAKMVQMENQPKRLVDPLFTPFQEAGRDGTYYVNLGTWDIQRHPGWYDLPRGGILCEQMGVGKTLMCLTLVLATLHQPPQRPPHSIDDSGTITSNAFETFPFPKQEQAREELSHKIDVPRDKIKLPSLFDLCIDVLSKHDHSWRQNDYLSDIALARLNRNSFYCVAPPDTWCLRKARTQAIRKQTKKVYLANTTLVVVPQILLVQWKDEIEKHLAPGTLRVLEIGKVMPPVEEMMQYDIVLIDVNRFGQEEALRRYQLDLPDSEFTKARWKRIILDEGHVAGDKQTNSMRLAISLSIERRWVVSGTPGKHLQQGGETELESMAIDVDDAGAENDDSAQQESSGGTRTWSQKDITDLTRLGVMIGGFLATEPFKSEGGFQEHVTNQIRRRGGPTFGSVRRLRYLMSEMMVKHAPKVIDLEACLPPMGLRTDVVQFHPMQRITYNVLVALIATNGWMCNFEDMDYFLHPRNTKAFQMMVSNLHLACFWYSAREIPVEASLRRTREYLKLKAETLSPEAKEGLEIAASHFERALDFPGWSEWMHTGISIPCDIDPAEFSETIRHAWSDGFPVNAEALDASSLFKLRGRNTQGRTEDELLAAAIEFKDQKEASFEAKTSKNGKIVQAKKGASLEVEGDGPHVSAPTVGPQLTKSKLETKPKRPTKKKKKREEIDLKLEEAVRNAEFLFASPPPPTGPRPLPTVIRMKSRSNKVNHVIDTIRASEMDDKFVIFGNAIELGHVTEALDLIDVRSCYIGGNVERAKRNAALKDFEKPETRVCLLDLKTGARGLNLVVANRMIFLGPVWNLDVQAQAIKRVHRIGQTRSTTIQILVTEGTFEEDIVNRASKLRSEQEEQLYSRAMIEKPRFVYPEHIQENDFTIRFTPEVIDEITPGSSTPTDMSPVTPVGPSGDDRVKVLLPPAPFDRLESLSPSPTPYQIGRKVDEPGDVGKGTVKTESIVDSGSSGKAVLTSALKRAGDEHETEKPKKRAKVAFA